MEPGFKTRLADCRVGLIGLGLMGGSLALALHGACRSISGYDVDPNTITQALDRGIIQRPIDLRGDEVDLLILAAPVSAILDWIDRVPQVFSGEFHLLDLGSTKTQIVERMQSLPDRISPLGGHPMCGKETSGLGVADGDLYRGCLFALTPLERTRPEYDGSRARTDRHVARPIAAARSPATRSRRRGDQPCALLAGLNR